MQPANTLYLLRRTTAGMDCVVSDQSICTKFGKNVSSCLSRRGRFLKSKKQVTTNDLQRKTEKMSNFHHRRHVFARGDETVKYFWTKLTNVPSRMLYLSENVFWDSWKPSDFLKHSAQQNVIYVKKTEFFRDLSLANLTRMRYITDKVFVEYW